MKSCPACSIFAPDSESVCPKCGNVMEFATPGINLATPTVPASARPKSNAGLGCIVMLGLAVALWTIWSSDSTKNSSNGNPPSTKTAKSGLELIDSKAIARDYGWSIVGHVRNNATRTYSYAQISFSLYDKAGNQVGSAFANINNLESGGTWKFEALVAENGATTWKFKELSGF
jgi:hypothetical protein